MRAFVRGGGFRRAGPGSVAVRVGRFVRAPCDRDQSGPFTEVHQPHTLRLPTGLAYLLGRGPDDPARGRDGEQLVVQIDDECTYQPATPAVPPVTPPKPEVKPEPEPAKPTTPAKPESRSDDGARALALLEGRNAPGPSGP